MSIQEQHARPRTVAITGAAGNLGRAVSAVFASHGDQLILIDRQRALDSLALQDVPSSCEPLDCDLSDMASVQSAVQAATRRFGQIDVLCNLAGGFHAGEPVHNTSEDAWNFLFDLNTRSIFNMTRAVVPVMLDAGRGWIVNVGAASAISGGKGMGAYAASKSAVTRLTESMAAELRHQAINVNCVLPSILNTPENRQAMPQTDAAEWVQPADLAEVIAFLCSDSARALHGACIPVTGLS